MLKRDKCKSLITFCAVLPLFLQAQKYEKSPNVIFIIADDLGYGDLGWLGAKTVNTPNVNRLADNGIRFTNCYATSSVSTPSRYGILTGMYPWRKEGTGVAAGDAAMIIGPNQHTLADVFQQAGYKTAGIGKWHLGIGDEKGKQNWNGLISPNLSDIGFDYSFIMAATADRVPCVYIENGEVVNLDPNDPIQTSYIKPFEGEPTGKSNPELLRILPSQGHDQSIVNGISRIGYTKGGKSALWRDEDIADRITDKAVQFIVDNKNKPFFLYFGTNDIHVPRVPNERFVGKSGMGPRGDAILEFDCSVGKVLNVLDSLGIADNTLIILTSDNGAVLDDGYHDRAVELLGQHKPNNDFRGGKYSIFEAGTKVPCIVSWRNGLKKPGLSNALISQIDFYASLSSLLGVKIPENAAPDSRNEIKALLGFTKKGRNYLVQQNVNSTLSVNTGIWKYIEPSNAETIEFWTKTELGNNPIPQLFNLKNDISETNNLAVIKKSKTKRFKKILQTEKSKKIVLP